jgi:glycosyltransferase involved in cell wall biosynthesis
MADRRRLSILIVARNAAATVARAVESCLPEAGCPILLVDDGSTDGTGAIARAAGGARLTVVRQQAPHGVSRARQRALDDTRTPFAAWLDADDEWLPGRADRLLTLLESGHEVATESIDLHDGPSGTWRRRLDVPSFVTAPGGAVRLFERNYLPGDTQLGFDVECFRRAGGYDPHVHGPESHDILLRALRQGARLGCGDAVGYRMYAYPGSVSRNLSRQRAALAAALRKHPYSEIQRLYADAGLPARVALWALVIVAQYRDEPLAALRFLEAASPDGSDGNEVLEPAGPWSFREGWRRTFHRGTILLSMGGHDEAALEQLSRAEEMQPTAEGANNLGVARSRVGDAARARELFAAAESRFPGYRDARVNAASVVPVCITTHPLRRTASRSEYANGSSALP